MALQLTSLPLYLEVFIEHSEPVLINEELTIIEVLFSDELQLWFYPFSIHTVGDTLLIPLRELRQRVNLNLGHVYSSGSSGTGTVRLSGRYSNIASPNIRRVRLDKGRET